MKKRLRRIVAVAVAFVMTLGICMPVWAASRDTTREYETAMAEARKLADYADDYGWAMTTARCQDSNAGTWVQTTFDYDGKRYVFYVLGTTDFKTRWWCEGKTRKVQTLKRWLRKNGSIGPSATQPVGYVDARTADAAQGQEIASFRTEIRDLTWNLEMDDVEVVSISDSYAETVLTFTKPGWEVCLTQKITANTSGYRGSFGAGFIAKYYDENGNEFSHSGVLSGLKGSN